MKNNSSQRPTSPSSPTSQTSQTSQTSPQKPLRNRLLGVIHTKIKQIGMPSDLYRDFLWDNFEVTSSADLNEDGLHELLRRLDRWKRPRARLADSRFIWVLWRQYLCPLLRDRERTDRYLCGIAQNATGSAVTDTDFDLLTPGDRHKIIEALKKRITQQGGDLPMR